MGGGEAKPRRVTWAGRFGDTELGGVRGMPGPCLAAAAKVAMDMILTGDLVPAEGDGLAKAMVIAEVAGGAISDLWYDGLRCTGVSQRRDRVV